MAEDTHTNSFLLKRLQSKDSQLAEEKFVNEATKLEILSGESQRLTRMSSQRRAPRSGARGGAQENGEEQQLWQDCVSVLAELQQKEKEAEDLKQQIFAEESRLSEAKRNGREPSVAEYYTLECMYRDEIKIAKDQEALIGVDDTSGLKQNVGLLAAMVKHNEEKVESSLPRGSASRDSRDSQSRSGMDMDGTSDSPGPPAADRQARKLGAGRTSSQPPRNLDVIIRSEAPSEPSERSSNKPKIVYAVGDEVAFKRKSGDDLDWIQGIVTRVIGEGKSRRYEVRDPYPDDKAAELNNNYKSSASQMVPIPSVGAKFEHYEVGKRVLALYPSTSTFYRADVKRMLEGGTKVEVLFEEEQEGKEVERRMVLNHTGQ